MVGATVDDDIDFSGEAGECRIIQAEHGIYELTGMCRDLVRFYRHPAGLRGLVLFLQKVYGMCVRHCVIGNKMLGNVASDEARGFCEQDIQIGAGVGRQDDCLSRRT